MTENGIAPAPPLFFSGGTAMHELGRRIAERRPDAIHVITTFDSGGSTAALRRAFAMPAPGDLRRRIGALADPAATPQPVLDFWEHRLPDEGNPEALRDDLRALGAAGNPLLAALPEAFATPLRRHILGFLENMPPDFDARRACFGNLVIAGAHLRYGRRLAPALAECARLLRARGRVLPVVEESLHLAAELDDGSHVVGQHLFRCLRRPVRRLLLTVHDPDHGQPPLPACRPRPAQKAVAAIAGAGLICYPMGSFYTSILANLLPGGIGRAIAANPCPKIFIPNLGVDGETALPVAERTRILLETLRADVPDAPTSSLLTHILVDGREGRHPGGCHPAGLEREFGVRVLDAPVAHPDDPQRHDAAAVRDILLAIADGTDETASAHA